MKTQLRFVVRIFFSASLACQLSFAQNTPGIKWQNTIGGNDDDELYTVIQTSDGGYLTGGASVSEISGDKTEGALGGYDYWIVKVDPYGNITWQKSFGGSGDDFLHSMIATSDGGYLLGGYSDSGISGNKTENQIGGFDYWIIKIDLSGNILWQNTIGGHEDDFLSSVIQTADGSYLVGGYSHSGISGDKSEVNQGSDWSGDYWVLKLDAAGNISWQNTIGGNNFDVLKTVIQTTDGGYLLGGHSMSDPSGDKTEKIGKNDYWLVKLDVSGNIIWQNTIGGYLNDYLASVIETKDGGYLVGGSSQSLISGDKTETRCGVNDYWVLKLDTSGNIIWQNTIGGSEADELTSLIQTSDSGYLLGGYSASGISCDKTEGSIGGSDYWIVRLDTSGNIAWQNTIGGNGDDYLNSVMLTSDSSILLGGYSASGISGEKTESCQGSHDYWVIKLVNEVDVGITEAHTGEFQISTIPNPTAGRITIEVTTPQQLISIRVVDIFGRELPWFNGDVMRGTFRKDLDLSSFPSGTYFLKVLHNGVSEMRKVIVQK